MSDKVKMTGIIGIIIIVISALISTDLMTTLTDGADAAIDISFVMSGITGIVTLATRPTKEKGDKK